jgi:hypothetical protein
MDVDIPQLLSMKASGIERISKLTGITELRLSTCSKLNDASLLQLVLMTKMEILSLARCVQVTDAGLLYLVKHHNLKVTISQSLIDLSF